jgi:hypothetical protein
MRKVLQYHVQNLEVPTGCNVDVASPPAHGHPKRFVTPYLKKRNKGSDFQCFVEQLDGLVIIANVLIVTSQVRNLTILSRK